MGLTPRALPEISIVISDLIEPTGSDKVTRRLISMTANARFGQSPAENGVTASGQSRLKSDCLADLSKYGFHHLRAVAQKVEMIRPVLHHADALIPIFPTRIGATHGVIVAVG